MAMKFAWTLVPVLLTTSVFATAMANKTYPAGGCPPCPCSGGSWGAPPPGINVTHEPKTVVVGGSENWHWGFDYTHWAINYSMSSNPFFVGDTLEFKYTTEHNHSVVLLPDYLSYQNCNVKSGKLLGGPGNGIEGVKFTLTDKKPFEDPHFYFACGEGNGIHCNAGKMRFSVLAWPRR